MYHGSRRIFIHKKLHLFALTFLIVFCLSYTLLAQDYSRMPPLFHLDPYEACISEDDAMYCTATIQLVSNGPSHLYDTITEYSERTLSHFNHTILKYGVCVTSACSEYITQNPQDPRWFLEACLNDSMYRDYELRTRVVDVVNCITKDDTAVIDTGDLVVAAIVGFILVMNLIGSLYEIFWIKDSKHGSHTLLIFSIRHNWRRLTARPGGPEPRLTRLKGINGIKSINMFLVIGLHAMLPFTINVANSRFMEEVYSDPLYSFVTNGTPIVQTFFLIGGFLLSYNFMIYTEKHSISWSMIPKAIFTRWLRLTPAYAVILGITATWLRHAGSGPLWNSVVVEESQHCQQYWWHHLLYINNYIDYSKCMPQMWYVACDFQLHIIGLLTLVLLSSTWRKAVLIIILAGGMLANSAHTYWQDLDAVLIPSPEASRNFYFTDPTFIHTYKRTHTNVSSYIIGLGLGLMIYNWQQTNYDINKVLKTRVMYWLSVPAMVCVLALGEVFYGDTERAPAYVRAIYSAFAKPVFSIVIAFIVIGMVYKYEDIYRGVLEWRGWSVLGRLVYSAYAVHVLVIKSVGGSQTILEHASVLNAAVKLVTANVLSFVLAVFLHLLVEAPFNQLLKPSPRQPSTEDSFKVTRDLTKEVESKKPNDFNVKKLDVPDKKLDNTSLKQ